MSTALLRLADGRVRVYCALVLDLVKESITKGDNSDPAEWLEDKNNGVTVQQSPEP